jgi:hypothetical protein
MTQLSFLFLPKNQLLVGINHSVEEEETSVNTSFRVHTLQVGFFFFILQLVRIKES